MGEWGRGSGRGGGEGEVGCRGKVGVQWNWEEGKNGKRSGSEFVYMVKHYTYCKISFL